VFTATRPVGLAGLGGKRRVHGPPRDDSFERVRDYYKPGFAPRVVNGVGN